MENQCHKTIDDFMITQGEIDIKALDEHSSSEVFGPSVEVQGKSFGYTCILQYEAADNLKYLDLLLKKYHFLPALEVPEIDLLDYLGEFLNILCGRVNKEIESTHSKLSIEIPYFSYGVHLQEGQKLKTLKCSFNELSFKLHFYSYSN